MNAGAGRWTALAWLIALPSLAPLLVVASSALAPTPEVSEHLWQYVLPDVLANTAWLVAGVCVGCLALGVPLAWLTTRFQFPGRRVFQWALVLPLALPGYVLAFVAIGLLDYAGPVQSFLREHLGADAGLPPVRSLGGVVAVMTLALYPYVYLITRGAFLAQSRSTHEAARSLGASRWETLFQVSLPMAWPWIGVSVLLVAMETLADFGTVATFNYDTFTTAIYKAWFGLFSLDAALQLAGVLLLAVLALVLLERVFSGRRRFEEHGPPPQRQKLTGAGAVIATTACSLVLGVAFVIPIAQLSVWAWQALDLEPLSRYLGYVWHSVSLAAMAGTAAAVLSVLLAYARRHSGGAPVRLATRVATLGYALPGPLLAVGVFVPLAAISAWINQGLEFGFGIEARVALQTGVLTLVVAYLVRFLAAAYGPVERGLQRIPIQLDEAARSLGAGPGELLRRVHLPLLRSGVISAALLVFVEVMKEMPITLMVRPFGWETLAVRVYELTSEGEWVRAALPSVCIVAAGLIPVALLVARGQSGREEVLDVA